MARGGWGGPVKAGNVLGRHFGFPGEVAEKVYSLEYRCYECKKIYRDRQTISAHPDKKHWICDKCTESVLLPASKPE